MKRKKAVANKKQSKTQKVEPESEKEIKLDNEPESKLLIPLEWKGFEAYRRNSAMFNFSSTQSLAIDVWGAPSVLNLHRAVLQSVNSGLLNLYLTQQKSEAVIPVTQETLMDLYGPELAPKSWMFVWTYFGLLHGLGIESVQKEEKSPIWMSTTSSLSLSRIFHTMLFCQFLSDFQVMNLLAQSLNAIMNTDVAISPHQYQKLLTYAAQLNINQMPHLFETLYKAVEPLAFLPIEEVNEQSLCHTVCLFCVSVLQNYELGDKKKIDTLLVILERYEYFLYHSNDFGQYGPKNEQLASCMISLTDTAWKNAHYLHKHLSHDSIRNESILAVNRGYHNESDSLLVSTLNTGLSRIHMYWKHVFHGIPYALQAQMFVSGSLLPMCLLRFYSHNFRLIVNSLFPESDMDVYVFGEHASTTTKQVQAYLQRNHKNLYEEKRNCFEPHQTTVITLVLPTHPLHQNQSLRVQLIYYDNPDLTPQQIVTYHHLCPVRAYYLPCNQEVIVAPSTLSCWVTGYMREYRVRNANTTVSLRSVLKYIGRTFGVYIPDDHEHDPSYARLSDAVSQLKRLIPRFEDDMSHCTCITDHHNLLLALFPKHNIHKTADQKLCLSQEVLNMLKAKEMY